MSPRAQRAFTTMADEQAHLPEAAFQKQVIGLSKQLGYKVRYEHTRIYSPAGYPDLTLVRVPNRSSPASRVIYAELKSHKGAPTPTQVEWLETLSMCGLETYLWRPADYDEVATILALGSPAASPTSWVNQRAKYVPPPEEEPLW